MIPFYQVPTSPERRFLPKSILLLFLLLGIALPLPAQHKNFLINRASPSWLMKVNALNKRPAAKDISDGYFLSLRENQNHVELQEDYNHIIREIVSDAGVQSGSQISVTYDPSFQKLIFHKIILWRNGKPSDRLKANGFKFLQTEKELSRFIYSGTFDALMVLDDVRKGDKIEYAFTLKGDNPIYGKKYTSVYYLESESSVGHLYTNVIFSNSRNLQLKNFNFDTKPKATETRGYKMYEWESTLTKTHRTVDFEPDWYNPFKRVQVSEYKSWAEVVNWGLAVNDYPNIKTPLVNRKVKELVAASRGNTKKYIELATRFVQDEIRYMGIEVGPYSHRPNSPEKVLAQRYGDCKDKSLLLVHLLKAQGVDAHMAYANTYTTLKTDNFLPSPFVFNHVIVCLDYNKRKVWIDPTISYQRGGLDNFYAPNYGYVLVIKPGVNKLEKIESKPAGKLTSHLTFKVADTIGDQKTILEVFSVYRDNYADDMRTQIAESGVENLEKSFLEYFAKLYPEIESMESIQVEDDENENVIEITEKYAIDNIWSDKADNEDQLAYFYGDLISSELREIKAKSRKTPIDLKHYLNIEQNITIDLPYALEPDEEIFKVDKKEYYFDFYKNQRDSTVKFFYEYQNKTDHIAGDQIKDYVKDIKKIDEYLTYYINRNVSGLSKPGFNSYLILPYLLTIAIAAFIFIKLYLKKSAFDIEQIAHARPVGGWLIAIAIRVFLFPISILAKPFSIDGFSYQMWDSAQAFGDIEWLVKAFFLLEIMSFALLFVYGIFCLVLFVNRRKEFPRYFIVMNMIFIAFSLFDQLFAWFLNTRSGHPAALNPSDIVAIIFSTGVSIVVIWYMLKSERVKSTFVTTYPASEWKPALSAYYLDAYRTPQQKTDPAETEETNPSGTSQT